MGSLRGPSQPRRPGVAGTNEDQLRAWNGPDGDSWADNRSFYDDVVRSLTPRLMDSADIGSQERVLDIGCGNGETTRLAARAARSGYALGVDLSARMIENARQQARAEGHTNVGFEQADAQVYPFAAGTFNAAISRYGAMFFDDPIAAFTNIALALTRDGRLAILSWRTLDDNEWLVEIRRALAAGRELPIPPTGVPGQFALADARVTRARLEAAGFGDITIDPVDEPLFFGSDPDSAFASVMGLPPVTGMLGGLDERARAAAIDVLRGSVEQHATKDGVLFGSGSWLVRATLAGR